MAERREYKPRFETAKAIKTSGGIEIDVLREPSERQCIVCHHPIPAGEWHSMLPDHTKTEQQPYCVRCRPFELAPLAGDSGEVVVGDAVPDGLPVESLPVVLDEPQAEESPKAD